MSRGGAETPAGATPARLTLLSLCLSPQVRPHRRGRRRHGSSEGCRQVREATGFPHTPGDSSHGALPKAGEPSRFSAAAIPSDPGAGYSQAWPNTALGHSCPQTPSTDRAPGSTCCPQAQATTSSHMGESPGWWKGGQGIETGGQIHVKLIQVIYKQAVTLISSETCCLKKVGKKKKLVSIA